jgi:hypothetical protein
MNAARNRPDRQNFRRMRMDARTCTAALLDDTKDTAEKAQVLCAYLQWHSHFGTYMGIGAKLGRTFAVEQLFKAVAADQPNRVAALKRVLEDIEKYGHERNSTVVSFHDLFAIVFLEKGHVQ